MEERCSLKHIKIFNFDLESLISDLQDPAYTQRLICKEDNRNYFATNSIHSYVNMKLLVSIKTNNRLARRPSGSRYRPS